MWPGGAGATGSASQPWCKLSCAFTPYFLAYGSEGPRETWVKTVVGGIRDGRCRAGARRAQKMRPPRWQASISSSAASLLVLSGASGASFAKPGKLHSGNVRQAVGRAAEAADIQETRVKAGAAAGQQLLIDAEEPAASHTI